MKISHIKLVSLFIGFAVTIMMFMTPVFAEKTVMEPASFIEWMYSLPQETRIVVDHVFKQDLDRQSKGIAGELTGSWKDNLYFELQAVTTPDQFKGFLKIVNRETEAPKLSALNDSSCDQCRYAVLRLTVARDLIGYALLEDPRLYCDFGIGNIDKVSIYLGQAQYHADLALNYAQDAFDTCSCASATAAKNERDLAKQYLATAMANTLTYCGASTPWQYEMERADLYLDRADYYLDECIEQACN